MIRPPKIADPDFPAAATPAATPEIRLPGPDGACPALSPMRIADAFEEA